MEVRDYLPKRIRDKVENIVDDDCVVIICE